MKRSTPVRAAVLPAALVLTLGVSACAANEKAPSGGGSSSTSGSGGSSSSSAPALNGTLNGAGSTAQQAAQQAWAAGIAQTQPGLQVNYDAQGSGAGRKQFLSGAVAFAGSDAYLTADELTQGQQACKGGSAIDVPDYISPIALVFNVKGVDKLQLSPATAAKIYNQKITTWDDPAIKADNPGATLPSTKITVVNRSDDSGTTQNFTDWLQKTAGADWPYPAAQKWPVSGGEAAQGTSGVIQAVTAADGAIGYADDSQAGTLGKASVKVGDAYVAPSADGAAKAVEETKPATGRPAGDIALDINRMPTAAGAYPVLLVSYAIACTAYADASTAANVKGYLSYITSADGQAAAVKAAKSAPLPSSLQSQVQQSLGMIKSGA